MPRIVDSFIPELDQEAQTTRRVLERIPEDRLGWKPHEKSMSLGQLAHHVATIPGEIAKVLAADTFDFSRIANNQPAPAESRAGLLRSFEESLSVAKEALNSYDDAKAMSTWSGVREGKTLLSLPRIAVVRAIMLNHWYHHRGQLSVYLRLLNVPVPSIYGPSADENPFA